MKSRVLFYFSFLFLALFMCVAVRGELVGRYSFTTGDTTVVDSISSLDGTLEEGASISGNQVHLDGVDDFVDLPGPLIAIDTFPAVTLELWSTQPVTNQDYSMTAALGGTWGNGTGRDYIMISTTRGNDVSRGAIANTPDQDEPWNDEVGVNGDELNDGIEHHYVLTINNTEIAYYIDGELQGTESMGGTTISEISNDYAYLGRSVYTGDDTVECSINEFRIYNSVLTPEEVSQHYSDGPDVISPVLVHRYSFTDGDTVAVDSVGDANGTLENGASISGNAVQLDGDNDYVNLPGGLIDGFTRVTFEAWFNHTANGTWTRVFDFGDTNPSTHLGRYYIFFTPDGMDSEARLVISDDDPGYATEEVAYTSTIDYGVPVYVACVYDDFDDTMSLYVDGELEHSIDVTIPLSSVDNVFSFLGKSLYIDDDPYLEGSIDEFRIYSSALTPGQIAQNYINGPDLIGESLLVIQESGGSTEVIEGGGASDDYTISLALQPEYSVTVTVDPDEQLDVGEGRGNPVEIVIEPEDWDSPQPVTVTAFDDDVLEDEPHLGIISHSIASEDPDFNDKPMPPVLVTILENECGAWGFLHSDLNFDCIVNFKDHAIFALYWLTTLEPVSLETIAEEWLRTTQPYAPDAEYGPVMDSPNPLSIEPDEVISDINEMIYGHFLEHIYHSVNGGLWGELVWNRSFEVSSSGGLWSIEGDELVQSSLATDIHMEFGDPSWEDYELTLEAKKDSGSEGFLILFRASDSDNFYWLNLGGWGNDYHAIEKEVNGSRSRVTSYVSGSINTVDWYNIRIRCEDNNFQVWLDDSPLFDYTDWDDPHVTGEVGVGTWATSARFKDINVIELGSGTPLWSGLPDVEEPIPDYWTKYGTGSFSIDTSALNSDFCLQIDNEDGTETGVQQTPFFIENGLTYYGSLWAKSTTAPASMVVRLKDGSTTIQEQGISVTSSSWAEYPFTFTPAQSAEDATLQVGVTGLETVYLDQVSMMGQDSNDTGGYRPDLLQAIDDLNAPCIRWPGGCFASLYLWKDGIGPQHERYKYPAYMWDDQDINSYGTDEFLRMCEALGVEPIIVINTGLLDSACGGTAQFKLEPEEYLQYAKDWVEYCNGPVESTWGAERATNGHPEPYNVKYWEIDNETWGAGIGAYCDAVNVFAPGLKLVDPNIIILACGSGGLGSQSWNQTLMDECADVIDYVSIHHYEGSGGYQSGPPAFEAFIEDLGDIIAASSNSDVRIYASEWNLQTTDWRTGLYAGGLLNAFERTSDVFHIGGPALFLRHQSASGWDNAFINFDHTGWFPAPNYVVMKLWHDNYAPYRINMTGDTGSLNAVATKSDDSNDIYFKVVNPTDQSVPVKLIISETFDAGGATLQLVAPDSLYARNTLESPNEVHPEEVYVSLNDQIVRFTMPRLSAAVVKVTRKE